jgi:Fumarylacetoacetate (FAA) hydrolase family
VRLCMFHPLSHALGRGWVGRVEGDHVIHLAAQTLQSFFTGGGAAREHAVYPLDAVRLLAPVLHPPSVRVFARQTSFEFANPAAIIGPGSQIERGRAPSDNLSQGSLDLHPRVAAVLGAAGEICGFTLCAEWRDPDHRPPKDRDFALGLGPTVVTPDELYPDGLEASVRVDGEERLSGSFDGFDWTAARDFAAQGTVLRPGDLLAGPDAGRVESIAPGSSVQVTVEGIGELAHMLLRD